MKLLPEDKLKWSPIVVNTRMNRERNASGVNSYEQEFKFKPEDYLATVIKNNGYAAWLDLCCGHGKALIQTAEYFSKLGLQNKIRLKGIDLIDTFENYDPNFTNLELSAQSLVDWVPDEQYDLITCVHGLHYLGDKLKVITNAINTLNPSGLFIGHLDLANIVVDRTHPNSQIKKIFKEQGLEYNSRTKVLKQNGGKTIQFNVQYNGADDEYGPNYTGQDSVSSYYTIQNKNS